MKIIILIITLTISVFAQLVATTKGNFSVEQGNAKYIIPIKTPKGVSIKPILSITYKSSFVKANGILGENFSLDTLSAITKCSNSYCLDGEKLTQVNGSKFNFKTEKDSFSKIISVVDTKDFNDNSIPTEWKIYTKDSLLKEYGTSVNSKDEGEYYLLTKISDKFGNIIYYDYDSDSKLSKITYANNNIYFNYEARDDIQNLSFKDYMFKSTSTRLKSIVIKTENQVLSTYNINYIYKNNKSYISSIKECIETNCKEPLIFTWNDNENAQVTEISNLKNEQIIIKYDNLKDSPFYSIDKSSIGTTTYYEKPDINVVIFYKTLNAMGTYNYTDFVYKNFGTDSIRGVLGFSYIKKELNVGYRTIETNYHQVYPYIGKIKNETILLSNSKHKYKENNYEDLSLNSNIYNPQLSKTTVKTYDINSGSLLTTKTIQNLNIDDYGNIEKSIETIIGTDGVTSTITTLNEFDNNESTWIIGKLKNKTTTYSRTGVENITRNFSFTYYDNGLLKDEIIEPNNTTHEMTTNYQYNSYGNLIKKTISAINTEARSESYTYDKNNINKTTITNSLGHKTIKNYDYKNQLTYVIDPNNLKTSFEYDIFGRKIKETKPTGIYTTWEYYWISNGYKIIEKIKNNFPITIYFNKVGNKIKTEKIGFDGRKIFQDFYYNVVFGVPHSKSTPYYNNETPSYISTAYDEISRVTKKVKPSINGSIITNKNVYNDFEMISSDAKGNIKKFIFDSTGKIIETEDNLTKVSYRYNAIGDLIQTIDNKGNKTFINYDVRGNKININDPDMGYWQYKYNGLGELIWQKDAKGQVTEFTYDKLGRKITKKENGITTGEWHYDSTSTYTFKGKLIWEKSKNKSKIYVYDNYGRITAEHYNLINNSFSNSGKIKRYNYDSYGRLNYKQLPNSIRIYNQYNTYGYLEAVKSEKLPIPPEEQLKYEQAIQEALNMEFTYYKKYLDTIDQISNYQKLLNSYKNTYSSEEYLLLIEELEGYISSYHLQAKVYFNKSQQYYHEYLLIKDDYDEQMDASHLLYIYNEYYDLANTYIQKGKDENTDEYLVEIINLRNKLSDLKEQYVNLTQYQNTANIYKISDSSYNYHYKILERDSFDRPIKFIYGNGVITEENYDHSGLLLDSKSGYDNDKDFIRSLEFDYDANRNVRTRYDRRLSVMQNYIYDSLDRVTNVYIDTKNDSSSLEYRYDELGNITYRTGLGSYSYKTDNSTRPHAVTKIGNTIYNYDANGNMTNGEGKSFSYSVSNKPIYIKKGSTTVTFEYDLNDERIKKTSSGTTTYYLGKDYEIVQNGNSVEEKAYIYLNGRALAVYNKRVTSDISYETHYLHYDNLGSVDTITNNLGIIAQRFAYKPFGERLALDKFGDNLEEDFGVNRGFTGHEHIDEVGLIHMNGRIYDSKIGRFISADPNIFHVFDTQGFNRYSYTRNNPLKYIDPSGYFDFGSDNDFEDPADEWGSDTIGDFSDFADSIGYGDLNDGDNESRADNGDKDYQEYVNSNENEYRIFEKKSKIAHASLIGPFFGIAKILIKTLKPNKLKSIDSRKKGAIKNYDINVNKKQMEDALRTKGYKESKSKDGKVSNFEKGNHRFTTRDPINVKTRDSPTIDYKNLDTGYNMKGRLIGD